MADAVSLEALRDGIDIVCFRAAKNLNAFVREIFVKPHQCQAWAIDRAFADFALETCCSSDQSQFQRLGMFLVKIFDCDERVRHGPERARDGVS